MIKRTLNTTLYFLYMLCFLVSISSIAQASPQIITKLDPNEGTTDTGFLFEVRIIVTDKSSIGKPAFKENRFFTVKPYSTSVQQHVVNNQIKLQRIFIFKITPRSQLVPGRYTTPEAYITIGNKQYNIPPESITITQTSNQPFQGKTGAQIPGSMDEFSFVQIVSNETPFVGEQVAYRLELITPSNLREARLEDFNPQGLWRERFENDGKSSRIVQNITIHSFTEAWFPVQSGTIEAPPRELRAQLQLPGKKRRNPNYGGGFSEQFFGSLFPLLDERRIVEKTITSNPLQLQVRPLPPAPFKNPGYIPVGDTRINSSIDKTSAGVGDSVTLTIQIISTGNLKPYNLPSPDLKNNKHFRIYNDKPIPSRTTGKGKVFFYKTFQISLVPQVPGILSVPEYTIYWFDPKSEEYKSEKTKALSITVEGEALQSEKDSDLAPEDSKEDKKDTPLEQLNKTYNKKIREIPPSIIAVLALAGFICLTGFIAIFHIRNRIELTHQKSETGFRLKEILTEVKQQSTFSQPEAERLVKDYIGVSFMIPAQSLTAEEIRKALKSSGILSGDDLSELHSFLLNSEQARYSGSEGASIHSEVLVSLLNRITQQV